MPDHPDDDQIIVPLDLEIRPMPSTPPSPAGQRLLGKSIALLAMTALLAYGCEKSKQLPPVTTPTPPASAKPAAAPPSTPADAKPTDAPKPPAASDAPKAADDPEKPKPIPHTELSKDAKAPTEFVAPPGNVIVQEFKSGEGFPVLPKAKVTVHFVLYLKDGWKKIDSTYERGEALTASVDEMVYGLGDGLIGMKKGGMRRIIVPPARAYGKDGKPGINGGPDIPPDATLVFDVDLVSIQQILLNTLPTPPAAPATPKPDAAPDMNK